MSKISAVTRIVSHPGRFDELVALVERMAATTVDETGTELYAVSRATKLENTIFFFELFSDRDAFKTHAAAGSAMHAPLQDLAAEIEIVLGEPLFGKTPFAGW